MKTIFVLRPHSVVDLITNSSSELFVYTGEKSVEAVEDIIKDLIKLNNDKVDLAEKFSKKDFYGWRTTYDDAFGGVFVAPTDSKNSQEFSEGYYGVDYSKGDIIVNSNGDNSIPWEIQEALENLGFRRYHLG